MTGTLEYFLLVQVMASGGKSPDRDTFIAVLRSARSQLSDEDYKLLQGDIKAILQNTLISETEETA